MTELKSLIIIAMVGVSFFTQVLFWAVYLVRFEIMEVIIRKWSYKKLAQAKIDVAEYMKTAPDLMDEKNSNTTNRSC
jgi:hypothetical protein